MKNKFNLSLFLKKIFKTFSYKLFFLFYGKISVNKKYENKIIKKKTIRLDSKFKYFILNVIIQESIQIEYKIQPLYIKI